MVSTRIAAANTANASPVAVAAATGRQSAPQPRAAAAAPTAPAARTIPNGPQPNAGTCGYASYASGTASSTAGGTHRASGCPDSGRDSSATVTASARQTAAHSVEEK